MDTNVQALKNLYVALGGEASDVEDLTTSSEVITAMESVAASAASELPKISSNDNGKLLVAQDGEFKTQLPGSAYDSCVGSFSGEDYTVTFTSVTREGARTKHKNNIGYHVNFLDSGRSCELTPNFPKSVGSGGSLDFRGFMISPDDDVYMIILTVSTSDEVTVRRIKLTSSSVTIPEA